MNATIVEGSKSVWIWLLPSQSEHTLWIGHDAARLD